MSDPINEYRLAMADLVGAKQKMLEATKKAWPLGMQVWNNKFLDNKNGRPIASTVCGYGGYTDPGSIRVRNNETGAIHEVWPYELVCGRPYATPMEATS